MKNWKEREETRGENEFGFGRIRGCW